MLKDNRYVVVKVMIETGHITTFSQIFDYIPISVVAIDYGSNYVRFARQISRPLSFRLKDLSILATLFGIETMSMITLIYNQQKRK
jgi:hypothetical protein